MFSIFHIPGANTFLSDRGISFPTGKAGNDIGDDSANDLGSARKVGNDRGDDSANDLGSARKVGAVSAGIRANTIGSWPPTVLPRDAPSDYPNVVQIFAYGA